MTAMIASAEDAGYADEPTVEEMLEFYDANEPASSLADAVAAVRHTLAEDDVTVTVDVHGRLVDLTLGPRAMRLRGAELAARVRSLAERAAHAALGEAVTMLTPHCSPTLAAVLAAALPQQ
ncbi:MAG TPA: hypothetical protein VGD67_20040 [Pseudonocardiaceae bacterium]